jgi:carboxylate-amine ligase
MASIGQFLLNSLVFPITFKLVRRLRGSRATVPSLELRIADVCTQVEDALCIAALFRCLVKHLSEQEDLNAEIGPVARAIAGENKWRAQRYGTSAHFVDQRSMKSISIDIVLQELLERLEADAKALDCVGEISRAVEILKRGSSADQQLRVYEEARATGHNRVQALKQVVDWLQQETIR